MEDPAMRNRVSGSESGGDLLEVLRTLAHELSQPLTSLRGSIEVALMGESDKAEYRRVLTLSLHESGRIAETLEIFRDVLDIEAPAEDIQRVSWTQSVEQLLEEAALADKNRPSQVAITLKGGVWVTASPHHLAAATGRLINSAVKAARRKHKVRIELSATEDTACLAVIDEGSHPAVESTANFQRDSEPETPLLARIDEWLIQRAIERQGGRLELRNISETCHCYQLNLPLQTSED